MATPGDATERARAVFLEWLRSRPPGVYRASIMSTEAMRLIDMFAAALTAAEDGARRAAIDEAAQICKDAHPNENPGYLAAKIRALATEAPKTSDEGQNTR